LKEDEEEIWSGRYPKNDVQHIPGRRRIGDNGVFHGRPV